MTEALARPYGLRKLLNRGMLLIAGTGLLECRCRDVAGGPNTAGTGRLDHHDRSADMHAIVEIDRVEVAHADATG